MARVKHLVETYTIKLCKFSTPQHVVSSVLLFQAWRGTYSFYCRTLSFCDGKGQEMPPDQREQVCGVRHLSSSPGMIPLFPVHSFFWNQFLNLGELAFLKAFFSHVFFFLNILIQLKMYSSITFFLSCAVVFIFYFLFNCIVFYGVVFLPSVHLLSNLVEVKPPLASGLKMPSWALPSLYLQPAREGISVSAEVAKTCTLPFPASHKAEFPGVAQDLWEEAFELGQVKCKWKKLGQLWNQNSTNEVKIVKNSSVL